MDFISLHSLLFLFFSIAINALLPQNIRHYWILACSVLFVFLLSWQSAIVLIVLGSFNFFIGNLIKNASFYFYIGLCINILAIVGFNYIGYYNKNLSVSLQTVQFSLNEFVLAIGLSFYTIQHIAYLIDIRKEKIKPENNYFHFLFCSTFFPKLISGPLTKYQELQGFIGQNNFTKENLWSGFNRFLMGVFKKLVIADRLAPSVHSVFDFNNEYPGLTLFAGALLFTLQLYFDFSGYTDMALGAAKMLGIELPENFNIPLRSTSISEFWRKWHISLIRFFTEYIFYPISFKFRKLKKAAAFIGIVFTFLISGIWHGIGITFFLWSLCHLIYLSIELLLLRKKSKSSFFKKAVAWLYVIVAVSFSNIFFRIKSTELLWIKCSAFFSLTNFVPANFASDFFAPIAVGWHQIEQFNFGITILFCFIFLVFERKLNVLSVQKKYSVFYAYFLIMFILLFGVFNAGEQFIYMQF